MLTVRDTVQAEDLNTILADVRLDEPLDWQADLVLVFYDGEEPIGLVAGQRAAWDDGRPYCLLEHIILRPAWQQRKLWREIGTRYADWLLAEHGIGAVACAIPRDKDRRVILSIAEQWGFRPYHVDESHVLMAWFNPAATTAKEATADVR